MPPRLILASTSRYRRELLERLAVPFVCLAPRCDEDALKDPALAPAAMCARLAEAKATSWSDVHGDAAIIGSDQVLVHDGVILGKPGTAERARAQLERLAGRTHELFTAVVVAHGARRWCHTDRTRITLRALAADAIARYVARDEPLDCAGSYQFERGGIALVARVESEDPSAITGLPLIALVGVLAELGIAVP